MADEKQMTKKLTEAEVVARMRDLADHLAAETGSPMVMIALTRPSASGTHAHAELAVTEGLVRDPAAGADSLVAIVLSTLGVARNLSDFLPKSVAEAISIAHRKFRQLRGPDGRV